jgi:hypothetical protein
MAVVTASLTVVVAPASLEAAAVGNGGSGRKESV